MPAPKIYVNGKLETKVINKLGVSNSAIDDHVIEKISQAKAASSANAINSVLELATHSVLKPAEKMVKVAAAVIPFPSKILTSSTHPAYTYHTGKCILKSFIFIGVVC